jgi:hypothetical protein
MSSTISAAGRISRGMSSSPGSGSLTPGPNARRCRPPAWTWLSAIGVIYAIGGTTISNSASGMVSIVQAYDPVIDTWHW